MLDIVIVNWNSGAYLRRCLGSFVTASANAIERVVVVDNASTDGSADSLPSAPQIQLVRNDVNVGFAAACNAGARLGSAPHILFLNPDTVVATEVFAPVLRVFRDRADVGICGVQLRDETDRVLPSCSRFPRPKTIWGHMFGADRLIPSVFPPIRMTDFDHRSSRYVDQVMGAFYLIRRGLFEDLGGFDERFFVYYEDVDLALRSAQRAQYSYFLAEVAATHHGRGSTDAIKARRQFYSVRSRILYGFKHFGRLSAALLSLSYLTLEPICRVIYFLSRRQVRLAYETSVGSAMLWGALPALARSGSADRGHNK